MSRRGCTGIVLTVLAAALLTPAVAHAQPASSGPFELSFEAGWTASTGLDSQDATEKRPSGGTLQLFAVDTSLEGVFSYGPRISARLTDALRVEGAGSIGRGGVKVDITDDFESANDVTIGEDVKQLLLEAGIIYQLTGTHSAARTQLFVSGGAGFFWDVHEGDTVSETGQLGYFGGGFKHALMLRTQRATFKAMGLRVDARLILRTGGAATDDDVHTVPALTAGLFVRF